MLIKVGDDISTDEILPAGAKALPYRSNIPEISRFTFEPIDPGYYERAFASKGQGHLIVAGKNYGQGSSREHAALAPRFLGVRAVLAKGFARIHGQNLVNFGILPLIFDDPADYERIEQGDELDLGGVRAALEAGEPRAGPPSGARSRAGAPSRDDPPAGRAGAGRRDHSARAGAGATRREGDTKPHEHGDRPRRRIRSDAGGRLRIAGIAGRAAGHKGEVEGIPSPYDYLLMALGA